MNRIKDRYTPAELDQVVEGFNQFGLVAAIYNELIELRKEVEEIKKNTEKRPVGRPKGSFKGDGPSKGYTPVSEQGMPEAPND